MRSASAGFRVESYSSAMVASGAAELGGSVDVRESGRADLDAFPRHDESRFDQNAATSNLRRNQSFWCDRADWHLFWRASTARRSARAVLSIHGDIGYLAAGSVLPASAGAACTQRLIAARIERRARGSVGSFVETRRGARRASAIQQRAGLVIAHVKSIWTNQRARSAPFTT
jgi:hypothetical protein